MYIILINIIITLSIYIIRFKDFLRNAIEGPGGTGFARLLQGLDDTSLRRQSPDSRRIVRDVPRNMASR